MAPSADSLVLPVAAGDGEGDRATRGGGAYGASGPSTMLRMVPLPIASQRGGLEL
jgi:hypothetical protein